jgi:hypothetical protein
MPACEVYFAAHSPTCLVCVGVPRRQAEVHQLGGGSRSAYSVLLYSNTTPRSVLLTLGCTDPLYTQPRVNRDHARPT